MLNEIQIGPVTIHMYGLMVGIGFLAAYLICCHRAKKQGLSEDILWGVLICSILGMLVGSRLLFYLVSLPDILKDPSILWDFRNGYVVYGGLIAGISFSGLYCKKKRGSFFEYFDLVMPSVSVAQGFGRVGCFFAGCCYGRQTDSWFHIMYTHSQFAPNNVWLIPTQLISSAGNFAIAAILFWYAKKNKVTGMVGAMYLALYSIGRFFIEMLRNDYRGFVGSFSTSQWISIGMVALAGGLMYYLRRRHQKELAVK